MNVSGVSAKLMPCCISRCQSFFWETELNWDGTLKKRTSQSESAAKSPLSPVNNDGVPMIAQRLIENAATHFGKAGTCTVLQPGDPPSWVVVFRAFCRVDAAEAKCQWDVGQALTKTQIHLRGGATAFENRKNRVGQQRQLQDVLSCIMHHYADITAPCAFSSCLICISTVLLS